MERRARVGSTRREFLSSAAATTAALAIVPGSWPARAAEQAAGAGIVPQARLAADPMRPQFHLLPARNWMNDPNGPIYYGGLYHMFFQYNPLAAVWGDMSWNHAVSSDMMHWTHMPVALTPTPGSPDAFGCFSGSAIEVGNRVYQVYTGTKISSKELATIRDGEDRIQESQCLAYSDDPKLVHWTKLPEPVIPLPPAGMHVTGFRDPSAWKQGDRYYMTVGSGEAKVGGCVLLYQSKDLKTWEYLHQLTSGVWNGKPTPNPCDDGEMWECPDFFALDGSHVLIYSTLGKVIWQSGELDRATMKFHAKKTGELDLGAFYAPKTQLDAQGQRILWGWVPEKRSEAAMCEAGWSGMMSLPRVMRLDQDGRLRLTTLPALQGLRGESIAAEVSGGSARLVLPGAAGEVEYSGDGQSGFDFVVSADGSEVLRVSYVADRHAFLADGKEIELEAGDGPQLHAYVDGSVVELIMAERIGYTKRFYYESRTAPNVTVTVTRRGAMASTLQGWAIKPISGNRLTTPA